MADQALIDAFRGVLEAQLEAFLDNLGEEMTDDTLTDLKDRELTAPLAMTERFRDALTINLESVSDGGDGSVCVHYLDTVECEPCGAANEAVTDLDDSADEDEDGE